MVSVNFLFVYYIFFYIKKVNISDDDDVRTAQPIFPLTTGLCTSQNALS